MTVTGRSSIQSTRSELYIQAGEATNNWHALHTRHQHEKTIAQAISNKGYNVFLPLYRATHLWRNRPKQLRIPLFPCYVFVQGGMDRQIDIISIPGVISIVRCGALPAVVPPEQIAAVRRIVENPSQVEPYDFLQCGDRVLVISGSLQGVDGILVRTKGMFRLVVSMEILGRSAAVEIDIASVRRIGAPLMAMGSRPHVAVA
jgi:transcription antitermination factor NusG